MSSNEQRQRQLKELHAKRKEETEKKIYEAIERLKEKNAKINYSAVSEESGISKRTLYNKPEVVKMIDSLRVKNGQKTKKVSDDSKDKIIELLKRKNEALQAENKDLKKQLAPYLIESYEKL